MKKYRISELFFPARCALCDKVLPWGEKEVCKSCKPKIRYVSGPTCFQCGKEVAETEEYCYDCKRKKHLYTRGAALFPYEDVRLSLYRYKYGGRQEYAAFYGRCMGEFFGEQIERWKPQAIVPVPLHKKRFQRRGYNQAALLARELSRHWQIPVLENLVLRVRNTRPMKEIDGEERQNNLKKAFLLGRNDVKLNTVIVIDDIYTTGATADAVSAVLREAGIQNIYILSLAIGHGM